MPFNVGDRVRRIGPDNRQGNVRRGAIYTVRVITGRYIGLEGVTGHNWLAAYFEPVQDDLYCVCFITRDETPRKFMLAVPNDRETAIRLASDALRNNIQYAEAHLIPVRSVLKVNRDGSLEEFT